MQLVGSPLNPREPGPWSGNRDPTFWWMEATLGELDRPVASPCASFGCGSGKRG